MNKHIAGALSRGFLAVNLLGCRYWRPTRPVSRWWGARTGRPLPTDWPVCRLQMWSLGRAQYYSVFTDWPGRSCDYWGATK